MQRIWNELGGMAILLLTGLALALALVVWMMVHRLRHPPRRTYASCVARGEPGDPSELTRPRNFHVIEHVLCATRILCWEIEGDDPSGAIVIVTPGWGDSKIGVLPRLGALAAHARIVIAWDPPGLGETKGRCALGTIEPQQLLELIAQARTTHGAAPIVLYGWSLGAGASIVAAAEADDPNLIAAVIAEAPYRQPWTPAFRVMHLAGLPWRISGPIAFALLGLRLGQGIRWPRFDRALFAMRLRTPLTVIHGTEDEISPLQDGKSIAASCAAGTLCAIEGAHHNDLWGEEFRNQTSRAVESSIVGAARREAPANTMTLA